MSAPKTIYLDQDSAANNSGLVLATTEKDMVEDAIAYHLVDQSEAEPKTCKWHYDGDMYETECGTAFYFNDGTAQENNANYCHKCGNRIEIVESDDD